MYSVLLKLVWFNFSSVSFFYIPQNETVGTNWFQACVYQSWIISSFLSNFSSNVLQSQIAIDSLVIIFTTEKKAWFTTNFSDSFNLWFLDFFLLLAAWTVFNLMSRSTNRLI